MIFMSNKSPRVCVLTAEQHLPSPGGGFASPGAAPQGDPQEGSRAGAEESVQTSELIFAEGVSLPQSCTGSAASLCSQALNMLTLKVRLLPQSFSVLGRAGCRDGAVWGI